MFSASRILIHFSQKLQKPICGNLKIHNKALSTAFHNHEFVNNQLNNKAYNLSFNGVISYSDKAFMNTRHMCSGVQLKKEKASISVLGKLRKQTGYSLSLCKKALNNCDQDLQKAKKWLEEQAQAQGWDKANKLEGRNTSQGLIGVCLSSDEKTATIVELNSETDFVARNKQFHTLLNQIISVITEHASGTSRESLIVKNYEKAILDQITTSEGKDKTLADLVALNIGQIGENILLRRATTISTSNLGDGDKENIKLSIVTHPSASPTSESGNVAYGRFGVILAYSKKKNVGTLPEGQTVAGIARQLCQHIIGMNPSSVGDLNDTSRWPDSKTDNIAPNEPEKSELGEGVKEDENWEHIGENKPDFDSSSELIHQPFLLNTDIIIRDLLVQTGVEVKTFIRFELGQDQ